MDRELFEIAIKGDDNKLQRIINEKPHLLEGKTAKLNTILHTASRQGHIRFVETISKQCSSLLEAKNCKGDTALHLAARAGHSDVVHLLLNHEPKLVYEINKDKASALYMAVEGGCLESVKHILKEVKNLPDEEKMEAACRGPENRTPLHLAVMLRQLDIAKELMMERKEFVKMKDTHGSYPLHYASALSWNSKMVELILQSDTSVAYLRNDDGQVPIHVAARNGCISVIKEFQRFCPDSGEALDFKGWNALHFAVGSGKVEVVKHILNSNELRELINEKNDEGNTPLHLAITKHQLSVFGILARDERIDAYVINREGKTVLDIVESDEELKKKFKKELNLIRRAKVNGGTYLNNTFHQTQCEQFEKTEKPNSSTISASMDKELFKIAREGKENELQRIIQEKPHLLEGKTPRQNTILHIASRLRHINFGETISMQCPSLLVAQNCNGDTALHLAARAGLSDMVGKLIECAERKNLEKEMLMMVNNEENTTLHEAARNSHDKVVHLLLNHQPELVYEINKDKASALYMAAGGCLGSVKRILEEVNKLPEEKKREAACRGPENRTPLHAAVMLGQKDIAEKLIDEMKEFARMKDADGNYPLHYASALGASVMVQIILKCDTSVAYLMNDEGQFPIHVAVRHGHIDVIKCFQQFCPDSSEVMDKRGWNALHFAVEMENMRVVKHMLNSNELGELINEPNNEGNTPLHLAIGHKISIFKVLVRDKRVDPNVMNREGKTPFDIANELDNRFRKFICRIALRRVGGKRGLHATVKRQYTSWFYGYRLKNVANTVLVVAALIITVSFAAAFTIPGGFNSDGPNKGRATLARKPLLWLFMITDGISLFSAIYIAWLVFYTGFDDEDLLKRSVSRSLDVMQISLGCLILSFVFGLWLVISKVLAIMFLIFSFVIFAFVGFGFGVVGPFTFPL